MQTQELSRSTRDAMAALHGVMLILELCKEYGLSITEPTTEESLQYLGKELSPTSKDEAAVYRFKALYLMFLTIYQEDLSKEMRQAMKQTDDFNIINRHFTQVTS